jgi:mannosyltransferase
MRDPWVLAAFAVALLARLVRLDAAALWLDEVFTADVVARSWSGMLAEVAGDNHPPLYFAVLKLWTDLAGTSAWALRLPSALLSALVVVVVARLAAIVAGERVARVAAWLAALSPMLIHHAQEARMYPLVALLAALHLVTLADFALGRRATLGWGFAATAAALAATHYYTIFFLAGSLAVVALLRPRPLAAWLPAAAGLVTAVGATVLLALLAARHSGGGEYALGPLAAPGMVWSMLAGYTLLPSSEELHARGAAAAFPYLALAVPAGLAMAAMLVRGLVAFGPRARAVILVPLAAVLLGPWTVMLVLGVGINPRYVTTGLPAFLVLLAAGLSMPGARALRGGAATVLVGTMLLASALHLRDPGHGREDVYAAGRWLDEHVPVAEEVLVTSREMEYLAAFHWPGRRLRPYPPPDVVAGPTTAEALATGLPFTPGADRVIFVVGRAWKSDPDGALLTALARRYPSCPGETVRGIRILCFGRADGGRLAASAPLAPSDAPAVH